ncbi:MAG: penicillin-binding protein 2 [Armatimonadetes bacterium]|nr:penicillin-binding protein 2 [Armatimonadota bacterium]
MTTETTQVTQSELERTRFALAFLVTVALALMLVTRIALLKTVGREHWTRVGAEMFGKGGPPKPSRGAILSADRVALAETREEPELIADPMKVANPAVTADALSGRLSAPAADVMPYLQRIKRKLPDGRIVDAHWRPIKVPLEPVAARRLCDELRTVQANSPLAGISVSWNQVRRYPSGPDLTAVLGLISGRGVGLSGLEYQQDKVLRPSAGRDHQPPADGRTIQLTIRSDAQQTAMACLREGLAACGAEAAQIIVMDPSTSSVLAMGSLPSLDPTDRSKLRTDTPEGHRLFYEMLRNRSLERFEPGSIMKLATAAAALDMGVIGPGFTLTCTGSIAIGKSHIRCPRTGNKGPAHGRLDLRGALAQSCNCYFAKVGDLMGRERMLQFLDHFGFLGKTGSGLPGDRRAVFSFGGPDANVIRAKDRGTVARIAFGQAISVSPLSLMRVYCALLTDGKLRPVRLVDRHLGPDGKTLWTAPVRPGNQIVRPETAALMRKYIENVVDTGTGKTGGVEGYRVGGKTATAQKVNPATRRYEFYVCSFIGVAPMSNPRLVTMVTMDKPSKGRHYGSVVAAPVFRQVAQKLLWQWSVRPDAAPEPAVKAQARVRVAAANRLRLGR